MTEPLPDWIVDPETHEALAPATEAQLRALAERVAKGLRRANGEPASAPEGAYLRADGSVAYLVEDGVANFVVDERLVLDPPL